MTDEFIMKNCTQCKDCHLVASHMYGCGHTPYKGKWIAEIEVCPKIATMNIQQYKEDKANELSHHS